MDDVAGNGDDDYAQDSRDDAKEMDFERGTLEDSADTDYDIYENSSNEEWAKRLEDGANDVDAPFKDLNGPSPDMDEVWDRPQKDRDASLQDRLVDQLREWSGTRELLDQLKSAGCTETRFRELDGWCSLKAFGLLAMLENDFGARVPIARFTECATLGELGSLAGVR
jgi:RNA polymerase sigma-54 factor